MLESVVRESVSVDSTSCFVLLESTPGVTGGESMLEYPTTRTAATLQARGTQCPLESEWTPVDAHTI